MVRLRGLAIAGVIFALLGGYAWLGPPLDISVIGQSQSLPAGQPLDEPRPVRAGLEIPVPAGVVPVVLYDGRVRTTIYTRQPTVEAVLREQGLELVAEDHITPQRTTVVRAGLEIYLKRATPITVVADGRVWDGRTQQQTVGAVLAERGIALMGQDYTRPALDQPVTTATQIDVVRVREVVEIAEDVTPFETNLVADDRLELDRQEVRQPGATGG